MSGKAAFTTLETTGGATIHRIPLEAFPNFWAYVYLLQKDAYCILIDTGSGTDTSHENLQFGLQQAGIEPAYLTHILLTHAHIDHFGGLTKLRPLTAAQIGCHELDFQTVAHHEARVALIGRRLASFLTETGLSQETRQQILSIYGFSNSIYQSIPVDFTYETMDMRLGPLELIHLPGHCPGHVAIRLDDVIFCGDMVVDGVTPHLSPESIHPYGGLDHYLESLARLQQWAKETPTILNGHDDVISDLPAQVELTEQNILRRMGKAVQALREPLTIEEICRSVYGETGGYNQLLVIEKTGVYVEYLYEHGMIVVNNLNDVERGEPPRYQGLKSEELIMAELEKNILKYTRTRIGL